MSPNTSPTLVGQALLTRIGEDFYALPIDVIEEVLPSLPFEKLPHCPDFLSGVVFVRGHLIPLFDGAERLRAARADSADGHIVCMTIDDRLVGLEVDEALDLIDLGGRGVLPSASLGSASEFFSGVIELDSRIVRILAPEKLVAEGEKSELEEMPRTSPRSQHGIAHT